MPPDLCDEPGPKSIRTKQPFDREDVGNSPEPAKLPTIVRDQA
jgi:hypothetical protein